MAEPEESAAPMVTSDGVQFRVVAVPVQTGKSPFREMAQSKKFIVFVAGMLATVFGKLGLAIDSETQKQLVDLVMVYVGAQGIADAGQGFARARALMPPPQSPTT